MAKRIFIRSLSVNILALSILATLLYLAAPASAAEIDCLKCHAKLTQEKTQHPAIAMGCPACHTDIDARTVPHTRTTSVNKGLSADQPDLCYGCHDKSLFSKKTVHAAVGMGCTGCHNPHSSKNLKLLNSEQPDLCYGCHDQSLFTRKTVHAAIGMGCTGCHDPHSSDNAKLLKSVPPELCFGCHDKADFSKKNIHAPVARGKCLSCHSPHATDNMALLLKEPVNVCLGCHDDVEKKPHAVKGPKGTGHPIGKKDVQDPKRPDKKFYCGSCHNPHSSDSMKLFRYNAKAVMGICINCHKFEL